MKTGLTEVFNGVSKMAAGKSGLTLQACPLPATTFNWIWL